MKKGILATLFVVAFLSSTAFSQWTYEGAWPDTNYKGGTHGIAVSPDGKVWTASYYRTNWHTPNGDTILTSPILVFNADGSFVDTIYTVTSGTTIDTLGVGLAADLPGCRGLAVDHEGNILFVSNNPKKLIKINYQTMVGMGSTLINQYPTAPSVSNDGTIFIAPIVGGGTNTIGMYESSTLNWIGDAVVGPANIARTVEVSGDGLTIYRPCFTGTPIQTYVYTRPDDLSDFTFADSVLQGMAVESSAWQPSTGLLWVSNSKAGTGGYTPNTWYGFNVTTKTIVDSLTLPLPNPVPGDDLPRGIDFSPDGSIAYVGMFGTGWNRVYKFEKVTGVEEQGQVVVNGYALSQNYPNPFNPSTKITFELKNSGYTTLKVYDMLGNEVATLVQNELTSGTHSVNFNAANFASGTYVYQLNVNGTRITNKMVLLK